MPEVEIPHDLNVLLKIYSKSFTQAEAAKINANLKTKLPQKQKFETEDDLYSTLKAFYKYGKIVEDDDFALLELLADKIPNKDHITPLIDDYKRSFPSKSKGLIGRSDERQKLLDYLSDKQVHGISLHGPSGVGKTTLAKDVAEEFKKDWEVFTFDMRGLKDVSTLYFCVLYELGLTTIARNVQEMQEEQAIREMEKRRILDNLISISSKRRTLLIFDNIESDMLTKDRNEFPSFINTITGSTACTEEGLKIVITSTSDIHECFVSSIKPLPIDPLPQKDSNEFICRSSKVDLSKDLMDGDKNMLSKIAECCRHTPYLLEGADHMMRNGFLSPTEVLHKIEAQRERGVPEEFVVIAALFETLPNDNLKELAVKICVFQRPFSASATIKVAEINSDYAALDLEYLTKHKVITKSTIDEKIKYDVHSLFKEFAASYLRGKFSVYQEVYQKAEQVFGQHFVSKLLKLADHLEKDFVEVYKKMDKNRLNFDLVLKLSSTNNEILGQLLHIKYHETICRVAILLESLKNIKERKMLFRTWADILEREGNFLTSANMRCWESIQMADVEGTGPSEEILDQAEKCFNQAMQKASPDPEQFSGVKGLILYCKGQLGYMKSANLDAKSANSKAKHIDNALTNLNGALEIHKHLYGDHTMIVRILNMQGNCYMEQENPETAEHKYKEAMEMKKRLTNRSERHIEIPTFYNQLSQVYQKLAEKQEGKFSFKSLLGGQSYAAKQLYDKAVERLKEAIELDKELGLDDTLSTATFNRNLANVLIPLKRYHEALDCARRCYFLRNKILGKHPETVRILYLMGVINEWRRDVRAALQCYEDAFKMEESLPMDNHSVVRVSLCKRLEAMCKKCKETQKLQEYIPRMKLIKEITTDSQGRTHDTKSGKLKSVASVGESSLSQPQQPEATQQQQQNPQQQQQQQQEKQHVLVREDEQMLGETSSTSISIDESGGSYDLPSHGIYLEFPQNALSDLITVSLMSEDAIPSPAGEMEAVVSYIVKLGPTGVILQKPVVVKMKHSGPLDMDHYENVVMAFNESTQKWYKLQEVKDTSLLPADNSSSLFQVQIERLTPLVVVTRLITDTFEVSVNGCVVTSSVCHDVTLEFPKGAVKKTLEGSLKVLPMRDVLPMKIVTSHFSPIIVVDGFEGISFSEAITLTVPYPCLANQPAGQIHVMCCQDDEWKDITDTVQYLEGESTIELRIIHCSIFWVLVGLAAVLPPSIIALQKLMSAIPKQTQQITTPQPVIFEAFKPVNNCASTSLKLLLLCMANNISAIKEILMQKYEEVARATAAMLPNGIAYTTVEGDFEVHGEDNDLKFEENAPCFKELKIRKKEDENSIENSEIVIKFCSDKEDTEKPLCVLTVYKSQLGIPAPTENILQTAYTGAPSLTDLIAADCFLIEKGFLVVIEIERFNPKPNQTTPKLEVREGSNKDVEALVNTFSKCLNFEISYIRNETRTDILIELERLLQQAYGGYDCCVVSILGHGKLQIIYDVEWVAVREKQITEIMKNCFCHKPKLLFIQACRKETPEESTAKIVLGSQQVRYEAGRTEELMQYPTSTSKLTALPDAQEAAQGTSTAVDESIIYRDKELLIMNACCEGKQAYRGNKSGSVFIKHLAKVLREKFRTLDIDSILTEVKRNVCEDTSFGTQQVSELRSTFTKKLYFTPKTC